MYNFAELTAGFIFNAVCSSQSHSCACSLCQLTVFSSQNSKKNDINSFFCTYSSRLALAKVD